MSYEETSHVCPGGAVHLATVFCIAPRVFQSDRCSPTFIHPGSPFLPNQADGLNRKTKACSSQGLEMPDVFLLSPGMLFTERGQASIQKVLLGK